MMTLLLEIGMAAMAVICAAVVVASMFLIRRDLNRLQVTEDRVDEQLHAIHEAMLLWNYGDRSEAIALLSEHDIFVREFSDS